MIRPGRPGDVAAIGALNTSYRLELAAAGRPEERPADVWRRWLDRRISAGDVRVAAEDEAVVGYIAWELRRLEQGRALAVRDLYVRPGERGLRHGAGLLARALDRARVRRRDADRGDGRPGRRGRARPGRRLAASSESTTRLIRRIAAEARPRLLTLRARPREARLQDP